MPKTWLQRMDSVLSTGFFLIWPVNFRYTYNRTSGEKKIGHLFIHWLLDAKIRLWISGSVLKWQRKNYRLPKKNTLTLTMSILIDFIQRGFCVLFNISNVTPNSFTGLLYCGFPRIGIFTFHRVTQSLLYLLKIKIIQLRRFRG